MGHTLASDGELMGICTLRPICASMVDPGVSVLLSTSGIPIPHKPSSSNTVHDPCHIVACVFPHLQVVDYNFLATVIAAFGQYMPDYKRAAMDEKKAH